MQKLVTIYLDNTAYKSDGILTNRASYHGQVEAHLSAELADGWSIRQITALGGGGEHLQVRGWLAVVLEKNA